MIIEKKKILQRRSESFRELFHDERLHKNIESLEILKFEVRLVLEKMNNNKNPGLNLIVIDMLTTLDDIVIDKTTELINKLYDCNNISVNRSRSVYVALPKKPGGNGNIKSR